MFTITQVLEIHHQAIDLHGGSNGIRDVEGLESAIARPFQTFGGENLYPTHIEKSAAIIESMIMNHPFVDGNKRTGYILGRLIMLLADSDFIAIEDEKYQFVIDVSTGTFRFEEIVEWIKSHS